MDNQRQELERLRKLKRLRELEAKAGSTSQLQAPASAKASESGAAQAALEGFGQTATMGYLPQIQAAIEPAFTKVADLVTGNNVYDSLPSYVERRDANIKRHAEQARAHPTASTVGKGAGIAAGMLVPGGAIAKGASLGKSVAQGAVSGLVQGAAYNPGDAEGVVDPLQLQDRAVNAGIGRQKIRAAIRAARRLTASAGRRRTVKRTLHGV